MLALCGLRPIYNVPRQRKEPRTDLQVSLVGGLQIHVKLKRSLLGEKAHDSAGVKEFRGFSDSEHNMVAHGIQHLAVSLLLRVADEQNLTGGKFLQLANPANFKGPVVDRRAAGNLRQESSKGEVSKDANEKRRFFLRQGLGRPLDKTGEIRQIVGFCAIFKRGGVLSWEGQRNQQEKQCRTCAQEPAGQPPRCTKPVLLFALKAKHKNPQVFSGTRMSIFEEVKQAKRLIRIEFS